MHPLKISSAIFAAVLLSASPARSQIVAAKAAADWPQWRGPNRDGKAIGFAAPEKWPASFMEKWKVTVGQGDSTPALVGDRLYVFSRQGGDEVISCLSAEDGAKIWQDRYPAQAVSGPAAGKHGGPRGSPTVAEGKVFALGVGGVLSCLDAASGKVLWRKDEIKGWPDFFTALSPLVAEGLCIAHLGGKENGAVVAYDMTGAEKWRWTGDGPSYSSPVLQAIEGIKTVVVQGDGNRIGLGLADGKLLWKTATKNRGGRAFAASPIVDGSLAIFTGGGRGIEAVRVEKSGGEFTAKEAWTNDKAVVVFNDPVLHEGLLFGATDRGNLFCLKAGDGQEAWTDPVRHTSFCAMVDAGAAIVALFDDGTLIAFKPSAKGYEELAKVKVASGGTYAHPVLSGKRIFVKDAESVTLYALE